MDQSKQMNDTIDFKFEDDKNKNEEIISYINMNDDLLFQYLNNNNNNFLQAENKFKIK